jgi:hypothetical protein
MKYCKSFVTVTDTFCTSIVLALLVGKFTGRPEGVTKEEVSIKNISNKKIRSVIEAMLKAESTLFLVCKFMTTSVLVTGQ